jgi:hypothetical protein
MRAFVSSFEKVGGDTVHTINQKEVSSGFKETHQ